MTPVAALQATLEAEHAAVYVLGVLGGRVAAGDHPGPAARLRAAYDVHRGRRDALRGTLAALGEEPAAAAAAYDVDLRTRRPGELLRKAQEVEATCTQVYAQTVAATSGRHRAWGVEAMLDSAVRRLELGGDPVTWPGLPELG